MILMQSHACAFGIMIDQAAIGRPRLADKCAPDFQHVLWDWRPAQALGVGRFIAIATPVGDPPVTSGRGHAHAHSLASRGNGGEERGLRDHTAQFVHYRCLRLGRQPALVDCHAAQDQGWLWHVVSSLCQMVILYRIARFHYVPMLAAPHGAAYIRAETQALRHVAGLLLIGGRMPKRVGPSSYRLSRRDRKHGQSDWY